MLRRPMFLKQPVDLAPELNVCVLVLQWQAEIAWTTRTKWKS